MFEMNEKQKSLFNALTSLQREVSLNNISGMSDIDAYKNSKGKAKKESTMRASVSEILINPNVVAFIDSMANNIVNPAIMSREEMLKDLTTVARVLSPDLTNNGIASLGELKNGFDVKLKAMKQLAELAGYDAPSKTDLTSSDGTMSPSQMSDAELMKIASE